MFLTQSALELGKYAESYKLVGGFYKRFLIMDESHDLYKEACEYLKEKFGADYQVFCCKILKNEWNANCDCYEIQGDLYRELKRGPVDG